MTAATCVTHAHSPAHRSVHRHAAAPRTEAAWTAARSASCSIQTREHSCSTPAAARRPLRSSGWRGRARPRFRTTRLLKTGSERYRSSASARRHNGVPQPGRAKRLQRECRRVAWLTAPGAMGSPACSNAARVLPAVEPPVGIAEVDGVSGSFGREREGACCGHGVGELAALVVHRADKPRSRVGRTRQRLAIVGGLSVCSTAWCAVPRSGTPRRCLAGVR